MSCGVTCFFFQAEDGIRDGHVTGVQTCALPISPRTASRSWETIGYWAVTLSPVNRLHPTAPRFMGDNWLLGCHLVARESAAPNGASIHGRQATARLSPC